MLSHMEVGGPSKWMTMAFNAVRVLTGRYSRLGEVKVNRVKEYAALFPEYVGRFVFIGDDGQGDMKAAEVK